jgi:endonuclease III
MQGNRRLAARGPARIQFYIAALTAVYGVKRPPPRRARPPALDELVLTVLSQNTNDLNRDRAWRSLRQKFPRWEDVSAARHREVVAAIRVGGLAEQKAERIQALLDRVREQEGSFSLDRLCRLHLEAARDDLLSFKGVGDKTAACVLLFSCGRPAFPVDTHILRLSRRLGLIPEKATAHEAHERLGRLVPGNKMFEFHLNLIAHGRAVCRAQKPDCPQCCLKSRCRYYRMKPES